MYAECARQSCAQQATVLLAFDPRGARAWLRDLVEANPAMGLMLCPEHAETTTVPMSWSLIDERSPDLDRAMDEEVDGPPPSFDDIFPPRAAREPDPYGLDPDLETPAAPAATTESDEDTAETWTAEDTSWTAEDDVWDSGPDYTQTLGPDDYESHEAVEWLAPELPASGTDGAPVRQPQLPMISAPTRDRSDGPGRPHAEQQQPGLQGHGTSEAAGPGDFLYTESPEERLETPMSTPVGTTDGSAISPTLGVQPTVAAPLFENTSIKTPRIAPPTSPLLSRAFRTAQFD